MKLIERSAQIAAQEASADGINWTFRQWLIFLENHAGAGFLKVPVKIRFLGSQIAKAMVKGYQGDDLSKQYHLVVCKTFCFVWCAGSRT
jgi:beta-glucosidase